MSRSRSKLAALLVCGSVACVEYDPVLAADEAGGDTASLGTPCEVADQARIRIEEYAFIVECGCLEPPGPDSKQCTVPVNAEVVWSFVGSLQHNVSSGDFATSGERVRGQHVVRFGAPGVYPYECSLHPGVMSNYSVVVVEPR